MAEPESAAWQVGAEIIEIWEDTLVLRIISDTMQALIRGHLVVMGPRLRIERYLNVDQCKELVCLTKLPPAAAITVRIRGIFQTPSEGSVWSLWTELKLQLLAPLVVSQGPALPDRIAVRWQVGLPEGLTQRVAPLASYHIQVERTESVLSTTVVDREFEAIPGGPQELVVGGLDPYREYKVHMRAERRPGPCGLQRAWCSWSPLVRMVTVFPVLTRALEIGQDYAALEWCREVPAGFDTSAPTCELGPGFAMADARVHRYRYSLWHAAHGVEQDLAALSGESEAAGQAPSGRRALQARELADEVPHKPNCHVLDGLVPDTAYVLRVSVLNATGCWSTPRCYAFRTLPPLTLLRVRKVTSSAIEAAWVRDDRPRPAPDRSAPGWEELKAATSVAALYQLRVVRVQTGEEVLLTQGADQPQHYMRCEGLQCDTQYALQVRSHSKRGYVSDWSRSVIVRTLERIRATVERRGATFIEVRWGRARVAPLVIGADGDYQLESPTTQTPAQGPQQGAAAVVSRARAKQNQQKQLRAIVDTVLVAETAAKVIVGAVSKEEEELLAPHAAGPRGEGDPQWGRVAGRADLQFGTVRHFDQPGGSTRFEGLVPDTEYRISVNCCTDEGVWLGRESIYVATLESDIEILPEHGALEAPPAGEAHDSGRAAQRTDGLRVDVREIGEDYALLAWRLFDDSAAHAGHYEYKIVLTQHVEPAYIGPPPGSSEKVDAIRPKGLHDTVPEEARRATEVGGSAVGGVEGHLRRTMYLRCQGRAARVEGLDANGRYTVRMTVFDPVNLRWSPLSEERMFTTVQHLEVLVQAIHRDAVMLRWTRAANRPLPPGMHPAHHPVAIHQYKIRVEDLADRTHRDIILDGATRPLAPQYNLRDLGGNTIHRIRVAAWYANDSWGSFSAPIDIAHFSVPFTVRSVGQTSINVGWEVPPLLECATDQEKAMLILSLRRVADGATPSEALWREDVSVSPSTTDYSFERLLPNTLYDLHIIFVSEVFVGSGTASLELPAGDPRRVAETIHRQIRTAPEPGLALMLSGEDFVVVRWQRRGSCADEDPVAPSWVSHPATDGKSGEELIAAKIERHRWREATDGGRARALIKYELQLTDCRTRRSFEDHVSPAVTHPAPHVTRKVQGLRPGTRYRIRLRQQLRCGAWGAPSAPLYVTTRPPLKLAVPCRGEDFLSLQWERERAPPRGLLEDDEPPEDSAQVSAPPPERYQVSIRLHAAAPNQTASASFPSRLAEATPPYPEVPRPAPQDPPRLISCSEPTLNVGGLVPNSLYAVRVRQLAAEDGWGGWSTEQRVRTLDVLTVRITSRGVDYVTVTCGRHCTQKQLLLMRGRDRAELISSIASLDVAVLDHLTGEVTQREVPREEGGWSRGEDLVIGGLEPDSELSVRLRPCYTDGTWGPWTAQASVRTLPPVQLRLANAGENFLSFTCERESGPPKPPDDAVEVPDGAPPPPPPPPAPAVLSWTVRCVCASGGAVGDAHPSVLDQHLPPGESALAQFEGLFPDTLYVVQACFVDDRKHRCPWSEPVHVSTLPTVHLSVSYLAESFVYASWSRPVFDYMGDQQLAALQTAGDLGCDLGWELLLFTAKPEPKVVERYELAGRVTELKVAGLKPATDYGIAVRASNCAPIPQSADHSVLLAEARSGMWSCKVYFRTPCCVQGSIWRVGQDYIAVSWREQESSSPSASQNGGEESLSPSVASPIRYGARRSARKHMATRLQRSIPRARVLGFELHARMIGSGEEGAEHHIADFHEWNEFETTFYHILKGLQHNSVYQVRLRPQYCTGELPDGTPRKDCGCFVAALYGRTLGRAHVKVVSIGEDSARFGCLAPPRSEAGGSLRHEGAIINVAPQFLTDDDAVREFEVRQNDQVLKQRVTVNFLEPGQAAELHVTQLGMDSHYRVLLRERVPQSAVSKCSVLERAVGEWVEFYDFHTKPYPPVLAKEHGGLLEWSHGTIAFAWGIRTDTHGEPKFDPDIPPNYMFQVEMKIPSDVHAKSKGWRVEDDPGPWTQVAVVKEGHVRIPVEEHISQIYFRVKAANNFIVDHGVKTPLWGEYSAIMHWQEPPRPLNPFSLRVKDLRSRAATLIWDRPLNHSTQCGLVYNILMADRNEYGDRRWVHIAQVSDPATGIPQYTLEDLTPSSVYRVSVRAESNFGKSAKPTVLTFTTQIDVTKHQDQRTRGGSNSSAAEEALPGCSLYNRFAVMLKQRKKENAQLLRKWRRMQSPGGGSGKGSPGMSRTFPPLRRRKRRGKAGAPAAAEGGEDASPPPASPAGTDPSDVQHTGEAGALGSLLRTAQSQQSPQQEEPDDPDGLALPRAQSTHGQLGAAPSPAAAPAPAAAQRRSFRKGSGRGSGVLTKRRGSSVSDPASGPRRLKSEPVRRNVAPLSGLSPVPASGLAVPEALRKVPSFAQHSPAQRQPPAAPPSAAEAAEDSPLQASLRVSVSRRAQPQQSQSTETPPGDQLGPGAACAPICWKWTASGSRTPGSASAQKHDVAPTAPTPGSAESGSRRNSPGRPRTAAAARAPPLT